MILTLKTRHPGALGASSCEETTLSCKHNSSIVISGVTHTAEEVK